MSQFLHEIIKKGFVVITFTFIFSGILFSQEDSIKRSSFYIGLWPSASTNGKEANLFTNHFSFNLLFANSRNENGFSFCALLNLIEENASGVQISGLGQNISQEGNGVAITGLFNIASVYNGLQISAGWNMANQLHGVQIGGFNSSSLMRGTQVGFANNTVEMNGLQLGFINMSEIQNGLQIGFLNQNKKVNGVQIGLINTADSSKYFLGLVNLIKNGQKGIALTCDEMMNLIPTFRSGTPDSYGIIGMGYNFKDLSNRIAIELGIGRSFALSPGLKINTELTATWMERTYIYFGDPEEEKRNDFDFQSIMRTSFRIVPVWNIFPSVQLMAGPSLNYMQTESPEAKALFHNQYFWRKNNESSLKQLYLGYVFGVQYNF